jgi:hypothetical protein
MKCQPLKVTEETAKEKNISTAKISTYSVFLGVGTGVFFGTIGSSSSSDSNGFFGVLRI